MLDMRDRRYCYYCSQIVVFLKPSKFTDVETNIINNLALEKLHRQRNLKEYVASSLLGEQIQLLG